MRSPTASGRPAPLVAQPRQTVVLNEERGGGKIKGFDQFREMLRATRGAAERFFWELMAACYQIDRRVQSRIPLGWISRLLGLSVRLGSFV